MDPHEESDDEDPETIGEREDQKAAGIMRALDPRERDLMRLRIGIDCEGARTFKEIGQLLTNQRTGKLGVTATRARELWVATLRRIREEKHTLCTICGKASDSVAWRDGRKTCTDCYPTAKVRVRLRGLAIGLAWFKIHNGTRSVRLTEGTILVKARNVPEHKSAWLGSLGWVFDGEAWRFNA